MDISGKTAIVTGGASGLGEATVRRLVAAGARVGIFDLNEASGRKLADEFGAQVLFQKADVPNEDSVTRAIENTLSEFNAIHICCNFAGIGAGAKTIGKDGPHSLDLYNKVIQINLVGTFNVLRLAAEQMTKNEPLNGSGNRGVIINTASVAAYEGQIGQVAYSASKGGVIGMTVPLARELAGAGIRVNTLVPGVIETPLFNDLDEKMINSLQASVLYPQRLGQPDEVAHLAQFIIENDYMNAECIRIDGGIRMQAR